MSHSVSTESAGEASNVDGRWRETNCQDRSLAPAMGSSASKITAQDRSVLQYDPVPLTPLTASLKQQRDKLRQYQQRIETVLAREQEIARQALSQGNKPRALIALRQKKYQQTLLAQTDSQLETLQKLASLLALSA